MRQVRLSRNCGIGMFFLLPLRKNYWVLLINCLAIIFLINFVSKSDKELSVSFISYSISFIPSPVSFNLLYSFLIRCNQV